MATAYLALGSNLGDRAAHLRKAWEKLNELPRTAVARISAFYQTPAVGGPGGQGDFLNAAAALDTHMPPRRLLMELLRIEREAGRDRSDEAVRWGPRPLDLDLLLYGDRVMDTPGLTLPHPRLHERWFVLRPLADLAPDVVHPRLGRRIIELLHEVERIADGPAE